MHTLTSDHHFEANIVRIVIEILQYLWLLFGYLQSAGSLLRNWITSTSYGRFSWTRVRTRFHMSFAFYFYGFFIWKFGCMC